MFTHTNRHHLLLINSKHILRGNIFNGDRESCNFHRSLGTILGFKGQVIVFLRHSRSTCQGKSYHCQRFSKQILFHNDLHFLPYLNFNIFKLHVIIRPLDLRKVKKQTLFFLKFYSMLFSEKNHI